MKKKPFAGMSQTEFVLTCLREGRTVTTATMLVEYSIFRLADVIYKLKARGHKIHTEIRQSVTGKRYAAYRLLEDSGQ